ncbi:protein YkpC [Metabacillus arenae]|nr:protein YkpC [Metabacillus arenae]
MFVRDLGRRFFISLVLTSIILGGMSLSLSALPQDEGEPVSYGK